MAIFFKLWVSHSFRFKSEKDEDPWVGPDDRVSATVTGVGLAFCSCGAAAFRFTLDGTFTDKEITSFLIDVESLDNLRRLREATLSSESESELLSELDSEPEPEFDSEPDTAGLDWFKAAPCSESLAESEWDDMAGPPVFSVINARFVRKLELARYLWEIVSCDRNAVVAADHEEARRES
jgi:hypothetical protein